MLSTRCRVTFPDLNKTFFAFNESEKILKEDCNLVLLLVSHSTKLSLLLRDFLPKPDSVSDAVLPIISLKHDSSDLLFLRFFFFFLLDFHVLITGSYCFITSRINGIVTFVRLSCFSFSSLMLTSGTMAVLEVKIYSLLNHSIIVFVHLNDLRLLSMDDCAFLLRHTIVDIVALRRHNTFSLSAILLVVDCLSCTLKPINDLFRTDDTLFLLQILLILSSDLHCLLIQGL